VEVEQGKDMRDVLDDIKSKVDAITTLPEEAEKPDVTKALRKRDVLTLTLSGKTNAKTLKLLGEKVRDEIAALPGISVVELTGVLPFEISIEVSEESLRRHRLTFNDVVRAVARSSLDLSGGSIETRAGDILIRTKGQAYNAMDYGRIPIVSRPDGATLRLKDLAKVKDGFQESDMFIRFDGQPTVMIEVFRVGRQNVLDVAEKVYAYAEKLRKELPPGINAEIWHDRSIYFKSRLNLLSKNGATGLVLVVVLLALFLQLRVAFWVSLGIPISFLGAIWLMPTFGVSLNMITMFAFILVLGIVVDDAIVIGENVYSEQQKTGKGLLGSIKGAQEMATPVVFAVLTTVAAFVPLLLIPGTFGQVWVMIPLVVIPCLVFSLVESLWILPAHLSHYRQNNHGPRGLARLWEPVNRYVNRGLRWFITRLYRPFLSACLTWRYLTLAAFIGLLVFSLAFLIGGRLKFVFFPPIESDFARCSVELLPGTPEEVMAKAIGRIEKAAQDLNQVYADKLKPGQKLVTHALAYGHENTGRVWLELLPSEDRVGTGVSASKVSDKWLELIGEIPEAVSLTIRSSLGHANRPISLQLAGQNMEHLVKASQELKERLDTYPGVREVEDSFRKGKQEIQLTLKPAAANLGINVYELARQVRQGFYGAEVQRIVRGRDEVKVMVRYPRERRRSLSTLEHMRVRTPEGEEVPLKAVAKIEMGRGLSTIERADRRRVVTVSAKVVPGKGNANEIVADLKRDFMPQLLAKYGGLTSTVEGDLKQQDETMESLYSNFAVALFVIFALMAVPFKSYVQPLIVMTAIPFSFIGVIWGHVSMGLTLSILSALGAVALAGVVVNDSLVLVDYINRNLDHGEELPETVRKAGEARFRPILLTTLTTFAGLIPLILEKSMQAQFLVPMAISLGFGVLFATFVTLILVPCCYLILEDAKASFRWWLRL
jgi:multidrug efflux pump subunit AcrB